MTQRTVALHCKIFHIYPTDAEGVALALHYDPAQQHQQPLIGHLLDNNAEFSHMLATFNGYVIALMVRGEAVSLRSMIGEVCAQLGLPAYVKQVEDALIEFEPTSDEQHATLLARAGQLQ